MRVLVTGGAGYVGSHACKYLKSNGHTPIVYDNLVYGHEWAVKWGPFYKGDLHDTELLKSVILKEKIEAVLHFAAFAYVGESVLDPEKYYINNVVGSLSLLQAMRDTGVARIIFSSTCATYGMPETVPISEDALQRPINPYGKTKKIVEDILQDYARANGLSAIALRYFNAAGADPDLEIGEDHRPETHLIPLAIAAAYSGEAMSVFGNDYATEDGTCIRDYVHVSDLARAHVQALLRLPEQNYFAAFNLGVGRGSSVTQVLRAVEKSTGNKLNIIYKERRAGDPPFLVADSKRANEILGWSPEYTGLDEIVSSAARWFVKHHMGEN